MIEKVKIYSLSDPTTIAVFYIGATKGSLENRLKGHLLTTSLSENGIVRNRENLIKSILAQGGLPIISLLDEVDFEKSSFYEKYYYELHLGKGCNLIQDPTKFTYFQSASTRNNINYSTEDRERNISMRLEQGLYDKIKAYSLENGLSVVSTIRFILTRFLNAQ